MRGSAVVARVRGGARRLWHDHRGWLGLVAGVAVGLLLATYVLPLLRDDGSLESGELVILSGTDSSDAGQQKQLVQTWNQTHPRNPAKFVEISGVADDQYSEMVARAQSEHLDVDVYNLDVIWIAEFAKAGYLRALDESTVDTGGFLRQPLATCRYDGRLWALPFNTDAGLLFYRKDLPGPPTRWADIETTTKQVLSGPHDQQLTAGYTGQLLDYEGLTVNALEAIWAGGGDLLDDNGTVVIDRDQATRGLRDLAKGLHANPQVVLPESLQYDETRSTQAFAEGRVLFMRNWPVAYRTLRAAEIAAGVPTRFDVTTLPGPSVLGGQNLAISARSRRPKAALALAQFLTDARSQQILFERGGLAATREVVYRDPQITKLYPYAQTLLTAIGEARPRPITPHYALFSAVFRALVRRMLADGAQIGPDDVQRLTDALKGLKRS
jgi:multiple sugar transport system substrate-binding protein